MIDPFGDKSPEQMLEMVRSDERGLSCSLQIGSQRHLVMATSSMNEGEDGAVCVILYSRGWSWGYIWISIISRGWEKSPI
jgi:hypothetical protein